MISTDQPQFERGQDFESTFWIKYEYFHKEEERISEGESSLRKDTYVPKVGEHRDTSRSFHDLF